MEFIYVFVVDGAEWEDIIVYLTKEEAIEKSKKCQKTRLEIFQKSEKGGYRPHYQFYLNGELVDKHYSN
jgi:hypothetical protein